MYIGVDYYPEQWPEERWEKDISMMKELGINVVRLAEFGWALMEPEEGVFDFSLFDRIMELLHKNDIKVVLGTPTATPPAWLIETYPEVLPFDENGSVIGFGARRHYTVNSPKYQELTEIIVEKMASHFAPHPSVIGWQTDNEYGHERSDRSYGEADQHAFQAWLQKKYSSLEELNERWGTVFWSQTYSKWSQIPVPRKVYQEHNPSLLLDFDRFCADAYTSYNKLQVDVLRRIIPAEQFVTHNFVYSGLAQDQKKMAEDLDFISFDNYPVWGGLAAPLSPAAIARQHDLCRGTKNGKGYWVMEELSGAQGWSQIGYLPRPGHIKLWTYQAISRGAEAIVYFRWRAARFGTEQFCHGVLDHDGVPRRKYEEIKDVIDSVKKISDDWIEADLKADIAFYHDPENDWAWQIQPQSDQFNYINEFLRFYEPAHELNAAANIIRDDEDLSKYKVVIVPAYFLTKQSFNEKLKQYTADGGTVILTYRTGVKDKDNVVTDKTLPGELADLAGIEIHEYESLRESNSSQLKGTAGCLKNFTSEVKVWCDYIEPVSAEILATYDDAWFAGKAAITRNEYGKGEVYYVGCAPEPGLLKELYRAIFKKTGTDIMESPDQVELVLRETSSHTYLSVLNHDVKNKQSVELPEGKWLDPAAEETHKKFLTLPPLASMVLVQPKE